MDKKNVHFLIMRNKPGKKLRKFTSKHNRHNPKNWTKMFAAYFFEKFIIYF